MVTHSEESQQFLWRGFGMHLCLVWACILTWLSYDKVQSPDLTDSCGKALPAELGCGEEAIRCPPHAPSQTHSPHFGQSWAPGPPVCLG